MKEFSLPSKAEVCVGPGEGPALLWTFVEGVHNVPLPFPFRLLCYEFDSSLQVPLDLGDVAIYTMMTVTRGNGLVEFYGNLIMVV